MTFCVFGAGLVGSYLGAAGKAELALRKRPGPIRESILLEGQHHIWQPSCPPALPSHLPILVATRAHQTPWALHNERWLAAQNGIGQACPMLVCFCAIDRSPDGHIMNRSAQPPRLIISTQSRPLWHKVIASWRQHGIAVSEVADVTPYQWEKAILNATLGPLCLANGKSMAALWQDSGTRSLVLEATEEGRHIALSAGISIDQGLLERTASFFDAIGDHRPSVLADSGELPWILDPLLQQAERQSLSCPALRHISRLIQEVA